MHRKLCPDPRPIAIHEIEDARWHARLVHNLGEDQRGERRNLGRFQHHGTAREQGRNNLEHDLIHRPVPRRDQTNNAHGFIDDPVVWRVIAQGALEIKIAGGGQGIFDMPWAAGRLLLCRQVNRCAHLGADRYAHVIGAGIIDF